MELSSLFFWNRSKFNQQLIAANARSLPSTVLLRRTSFAQQTTLLKKCLIIELFLRFMIDVDPPRAGSQLSAVRSPPPFYTLHESQKKSDYSTFFEIHKKIFRTEWKFPHAWKLEKRRAATPLAALPGAHSNLREEGRRKGSNQSEQGKSNGIRPKPEDRGRNRDSRREKRSTRKGPNLKPL